VGYGSGARGNEPSAVLTDNGAEPARGMLFDGDGNA